MLAQSVDGYKLSPFTTGSLFYKHLFLSDPNWTPPAGVHSILYLCITFLA